MGHRRTASDDSSLDLLLDTITNTLGGILFLAILLVLLTKASKALVTEDRQATPIEVETIRDEIQEAEAKLADLQAELAQSQAMLGRLADPERRTLAVAISKSRSAVAELMLERDALIAASEAGKQRSDALENAKAELNDELQARQERLAELLGELADEVDSRREDLPLPREQTARGQPFGVVVRYGRLYFDRRSVPSDANTPNLDDFIDLGAERDKDTGTQFHVITPKPWGGTVVLGPNGLTAAAQDAVSAWSPRRYYPTVSIWDDSYAEMRALREFFVRQGYRYRLIPVTDGGEVIETRVSNVQVQ